MKGKSFGNLKWFLDLIQFFYCLNLQSEAWACKSFFLASQQNWVHVMFKTKFDICCQSGLEKQCKMLVNFCGVFLPFGENCSIVLLSPPKLWPGIIATWHTLLTEAMYKYSWNLTNMMSCWSIRFNLKVQLKDNGSGCKEVSKTSLFRFWKESKK